MPGLKQPCPTVAACWSPAMPRMRMGAPNKSGAVTPNSPAQSAHLRQQALRHAEHPAQTVVPLAAADIEQQRARGIAGVGGVHFAAGEPPQQETVDGAEGEPAGLRLRARAVHVIEQPGDLAGGKIRIEQQPGLGGDLRLMAGAAQRIAKIRGAAVLPDDGVVDRLAAGAVPDNRGFALIGDADAGDVARAKPGLAPSPRARSRPSPARFPRGRARPSRAPDRSGAAPAARWRAA